MVDVRNFLLETRMYGQAQCEDYFETDHKDVQWNGVDWTHPAQDRTCSGLSRAL
jgi:hypothetical protein